MSGSWTFAGPQTAPLTTTSTQRLTGSAMIPLRVDIAVMSFDLDLCYQSTVAGSPVLNFSSITYSTAQVDGTAHSQAVAASKVPGAGTWKVGVCVRSPGGSTNPNQSFNLLGDWVNGYVLVTG